MVRMPCTKKSIPSVWFELGVQAASMMLLNVVAPVGAIVAAAMVVPSHTVDALAVALLELFLPLTGLYSDLHDSDADS